MVDLERGSNGNDAAALEIDNDSVGCCLAFGSGRVGDMERH